MDEYSSFTYSNFMQAVGERRLQRFYFPILIGLFFFYLGTFIWLTPMAAAIPGIIGGWFYHRRGALITSGFVTGINLILIRLGLYGTGHVSLNLAASFLVGHLLIVGTALAVGYFREEIERQHRIDKRVQARERHLILINMATKEILEGGDLDNIYYNLITRLTNLVTADHGCLLVWDDKLQNISLTVTTYQADQPQSSLPLHSEEIAIIRSLLEDRHIVFMDNTEQSMQYAKICTFNTIRESTRAAILIPLATHDFRFGVVALAFVTPLSLDREEISYIELTSQQITLALRSVQQEQQIEKQLQVDQALLSIGRALGENEHIGTGKVLQLIVDAARELMPHAEKSVIHLLDEEAQTLFAHAVSGFEEHEDAFRRIGMRLGEGIAGQAISDGVSINIGDILKHPGFIPATANPNYRSLLVVPVQSGMKPIGTISIQSTQYNAFKERDAEILKALSIQAAVAIENTRLFETTQQQLKEVNILYQISRALAISIDAEQLIHDTTELLQLNFEYYYAQVFLIEPDTHNLILKHGSGEIGKKLVQNGHYLPAGEGVVGHVAATGLPFVTNNVDDVVFFKRNPLLQETQYEIAVPIVIEGQVMGVIDIQQIPPRRFSDRDLQLTIGIADQLAVMLEKANLYSALQTALQQEQKVRSQLIQSERLALVGRLLASVSHELNNPLQAIQNALFLLKEEKSISEQARQDLDVILSEAERMAALIERLRSAYRPVRMKDFQAVDLNSLIEDVHMLISTHMRHKTIVFEFLPEAELPAVSGLPDQLRQVVLNLFLNAIEIMKPGGRLTVQTRYLIANNEVLLTVKDTGPGIDSEILPRIFDAFITTKHTGTGLGLTITHDIIQQHHGRITAENDPEGGAVFNVWLPIDERGDA